MNSKTEKDFKDFESSLDKISSSFNKINSNYCYWKVNEVKVNTIIFFSSQFI